jgi:hypothetical protein
MMPKVLPSSAILLAACFVFAVSSSAWAGYSVEISVNGGPPVVFPDNVGPDLNPVMFDMEIPFTVTDAGANWTASGTVIATGGGDGAPPVFTVVTDTLIEKLLPGLFNGTILVAHNYAASGLQVHTAHIDGQFENTLGNPISYAELFYSPSVNGFGMGTAHEGPAINTVGPVPFDEDLGPLPLPTTTRHEINISFYLDSPGDAIRLFNSAELRTRVPEPATGTLALAATGLATLLTRRRRD